MSLILITGSMFSEKTTTLLSYARKYRLAKKKVVLIKYAGDTRYSASAISSHNKDYIDSTFNLNLLALVRNDPLVETGQVILIDEGQFFPDLAELCAYWTAQGKHIVISALNGTFERKPFSAISNVLPLVTRIIHLSAVCTSCGQDAHFSHLKSDDAKDEIRIGGADTYEALCMACFTRLKELPA